MRKYLLGTMFLALSLSLQQAMGSEQWYATVGEQLYTGNLTDWNGTPLRLLDTYPDDLSALPGAVYAHNGQGGLVNVLSPITGATVDYFWISINGTRLVDLGIRTKGLAWDGSQYFWTYAYYAGTWYVGAFPLHGDANHLADLAILRTVVGTFDFGTTGPAYVADKVINGLLMTEDAGTPSRLGYTELVQDTWHTIEFTDPPVPLAYRYADQFYYGIFNYGTGNLVFQMGGTYQHEFGVSGQVGSWTLAAFQ